MSNSRKKVAGMVFAVENIIFPNFKIHFQFIWGEPSNFKLLKVRHWNLPSIHAGIISITIVIIIIFSIVIMLIGYLWRVSELPSLTI